MLAPVGSVVERGGEGPGDVDRFRVLVEMCGDTIGKWCRALDSW